MPVLRNARLAITVSLMLMSLTATMLYAAPGQHFHPVKHSHKTKKGIHHSAHVYTQAEALAKASAVFEAYKNAIPGSEAAKRLFSPGGKLICDNRTIRGEQMVSLNYHSLPMEFFQVFLNNGLFYPMVFSSATSRQVTFNFYQSAGDASIKNLTAGTVVIAPNRRGIWQIVSLRETLNDRNGQFSKLVDVMHDPAKLKQLKDRLHQIALAETNPAKTEIADKDNQKMRGRGH